MHQGPALYTHPCTMLGQVSSSCGLVSWLICIRSRCDDVNRISQAASNTQYLCSKTRHPVFTGQIEGTYLRYVNLKMYKLNSPNISSNKCICPRHQSRIWKEDLCYKSKHINRFDRKNSKRTADRELCCRIQRPAIRQQQCDVTWREQSLKVGQAAPATLTPSSPLQLQRQ